MNVQQKLLETLKICKTLKALKQTHLQILVNGLKDCNFTLPKLITLSAELGFFDFAFRAFRNFHGSDVFAYNTMIKCFVKKCPLKALRVYDQMKAFEVSPNATTFTLILRDFDSPDRHEYGLVVHTEIVKLGFYSSVFVGNTLLKFYAKVLDFARKVFEEMPERDVVSWNSMIASCMACGEVEAAIRLFDFTPERNIVTWNSVVSGLCRAGNMELARSVFDRMQERDEFSWNAMISGYVRAGDLKSAEKIFHETPEKTVVSWTAMVSGYTTVGDVESARNVFDRMPIRNVVSWNSMIGCYVHNHMFDQGLHLFSQMLLDGKIKPDETTLVSVLSSCTHLGSIEHGKWIDSYIKRNHISLSTHLGNALMDMFAKNGDIENAISVFNKMPLRCIITWTTMISGLAVNGKCREALNIFDEMCSLGVKPDDVIFLAVLSACTHGGYVEQGKRVFGQMVHEFRIEPRIEHYGSIVDLLGRAGKLDEAVRFIENMHLKPNAVIWATILGSCKIHGNRDLLEYVTRMIVDQEPSNPSYLTLISNLSASAGRWKEASGYRMAMSQRGVEKVPGCSSIQVGNEVHEFLARDMRHKERNDIYQVLRCLNRHLYATSDATLL